MTQKNLLPSELLLLNRTRRNVYPTQFSPSFVVFAFYMSQTDLNGSRICRMSYAANQGKRSRLWRHVHVPVKILSSSGDVTQSATDPNKPQANAVVSFRKLVVCK